MSFGGGPGGLPLGGGMPGMTPELLEMQRMAMMNPEALLALQAVSGRARRLPGWAAGRAATVPARGAHITAEGLRR